MLKLNNQELPPDAQSHLESLHAHIEAQHDFSLRSEKAGILWDNKTSSIKGKAAFGIIKQTLTEMCVGSGICNYCEQSEAADIEHILPKSLFPEQAFIWDNYFLACKECNTGHKLDQMYVFVPDGSDTPELIKRGTQPSSQDYAFIHLRHEDPMEFLWLDLSDYQFYCHPAQRSDKRSFNKVECTLKILQLNNGRDILPRQRSNAFEFFKMLLCQYVAVKQSVIHKDLVDAVKGRPAIDASKPFEEEQKRLLEGIKRAIHDSTHPTVWWEMVRQRETALPKPMLELFENAKELWESPPLHPPIK